MRRHAATFRIRYHECDQQGVLFNAHYLALFDMAVTELWRAMLGGYAVMLDRGVDLVVGEAHVRYLAPARFDDLVTVSVQVADLGTTSLRTEYEVTREEDLLATGWLRHVFVQLGEGTKLAVPEDIREALQAPVSSAG
jgi:acyl-CoA thioester hydrolase